MILLMKGDKYILLKRYLQNCHKEEVTLSFFDIENILKETLPNSAYRHPEWWANNPSHSQAVAWLDAGYAKTALDKQKQIVSFYLTDKKSKHTNRMASGNIDKPKTIQQLQNQATSQMRSGKVFAIDGYEFCFIQQLSPECKPDGSIKRFYPQKDYQNEKGLPLLYNGNGAFCRFAIKAPNCSGVYLWVVENEIIYIGETADLRRRFNQGYGYIAPRNCYIGGQSTNCKMNKVVLELYEHEELVDLYFYETPDYKQLELELLRNHQTKYNVKDNQQTGDRYDRLEWKREN